MLFLSFVVDGHGLRNFCGGVHEGVFEVVERLLLGGFRCLEAGNVLTAREEGRGELACELHEPVAGVGDERAEEVGETAVGGDVERGVECGAGGRGGVVSHGEVLLCGAHVGTGGEFNHGDGLAEHRGRGHGSGGGDSPGLRHHVLEERHRVLRLVEADLYVGDGSENAVVLRGALYNGGLVETAGELEVLHHVDTLTPYLGGLTREGELAFESGDGVVAGGHAADNLRAHGLLVGLALAELSLSAALGVEELAEDVDFPAHRHGNLVSPVELVAGIGGSSTVWRERHGGEIGELGSLELSLRHAHVETRVVEVFVVDERGIDEVDEGGVGEHLLPGEIAEGEGVGALLQGAGVFLHELRFGVLRVVFFVDPAAAERGGAQCDCKEE